MLFDIAVNRRGNWLLLLLSWERKKLITPSSELSSILDSVSSRWPVAIVTDRADRADTRLESNQSSFCRDRTNWPRHPIPRPRGHGHSFYWPVYKKIIRSNFIFSLAPFSWFWHRAPGVTLCQPTRAWTFISLPLTSVEWFTSDRYLPDPVHVPLPSAVPGKTRVDSPPPQKK